MSKTSSILNFGPKMSRFTHFSGVKFGNSTGVKDLPNSMSADSIHFCLYIVQLRNKSRRRYLLSPMTPWDPTLPPERTQPQKLCTANFYSGTLKTLINRLLRLKIKKIWRAPCEKMPFWFLPIIKSVPQKGQNTPKSVFRGPKIPPRGASSTWKM